jgi:acetoacetyl-CoA reductase/3-oxoacyl-[acyl-carrier protein] reductase
MLGNSFREFDGRRVAITAAGNGIGKATAHLFATSGADLVAIDRDVKSLEATVSEIRYGGGKIEGRAINCVDAHSVAEGFTGIGPVDVLVNCVGSTAHKHSSEFWNSQPETWRWVVDICLFSAMLCARQVVPGMRTRRTGKIVNISTDAALRPTPKLVDYAAAKSGVIGFTRALAVELAPFSINVNAICPGLIRTQGLEHIPASVLESAKAEIPLGTIGDPIDIANAILFLASDRSRYITGQTLAVNGGRSML